MNIQEQIKNLSALIKRLQTADTSYRINADLRKLNPENYCDTESYDVSGEDGTYAVETNAFTTTVEMYYNTNMTLQGFLQKVQEIKSELSERII